MEFLASYDFETSYTPGKGNVVVDALSRKKLTLSPLFVKRQSLEYIANFNFRPSSEILPGLLASLEVRPTLLDSIGTGQREDPQLVDVIDKLSRGEILVTSIDTPLMIRGGWDGMEDYASRKQKIWWRWFWKKHTIPR